MRTSLSCWHATVRTCLAHLHAPTPTQHTDTEPCVCVCVWWVGIWDCMTNQQVVNYVRLRIANAVPLDAICEQARCAPLGVGQCVCVGGRGGGPLRFPSLVLH
jgi:hypothetical protein